MPHMNRFLLPLAFCAMFESAAIAQTSNVTFSFENSTDSKPAIEAKLIGPIAYEPGTAGKAATFRGSSSIEVAHSRLFESPAWTISAWACPEQERCSGRIVEKGASNSFWLTFYWGRARCGFFSKEDGYQEIDSATKFKANEWHHVAGVFDGQTLKLYVDGKMEIMKNTHGVPNSTKQPFVIGAKHQGIAADSFIGALDEVSFHNRALPDSEILALYQAGQ